MIFLMIFVYFRDMKPYKWTTRLSEADSLRLWKISYVWTRLDKYRQYVLGGDKSTHTSAKS